MRALTATFFTATFFTATFFVATSASAQELRWPSTATTLPRQGGGEHDTAVVVGITDYLLLPDIQGAADNARDWSQHLVRVRGLKSERVTLLTDAEATKERIERALRAAATQATPQGRLWFLFIGHGAPSPSGDDGLLLGADAQADNDSLAARGVSQAAIEALIATGKQRDSVVVYDACFSGRSHDGAVSLVPNTQATLPVRRVTPETKEARTIVLASSDSFAGPLPGEARPAFSYLLLGAARGWAEDKDGDGTLSVDEAFSFAHGTLQAALKQSARLPVKRGGAPKTALAVRAAEQAPDINALIMRRCPEGTRWGGRSCVVVNCPKGTSWNGTSCAAQAVAVTCPAGTTWNGTSCVAANVSCPKGARWDGSRCVADVPAAPPPSAPPSPAPAPGPAPPAAATLTVVEGPPPVRGPGFEQRAMMFVESLAMVNRIAMLDDGVVVQTDGLFQPGSAVLTTEGDMLVYALAKEIAGTPGKINIDCHTDASGDPSFTRLLSSKRAVALSRVFNTELGANRSGVIRGHGSQQPLDAHNDVVNRRCTIRMPGASWD